MSASCFHTNKVSKLVKYSRVTHYKTRPLFIAPLETANIEGDRCWDDRIINKQHPWYKYVTGCNHVHLLITVIDIKSPYCCPAIYLMKILLIIHLAEAFDISHPSDGKIMHARVLESQLNKSVYINRTPVYHYIYFKRIYRCYIISCFIFWNIYTYATSFQVFSPLFILPSSSLILDVLPFFFF